MSFILICLSYLSCQSNKDESKDRKIKDLEEKVSELESKDEQVTRENPSTNSPSKTGSNSPLVDPNSIITYIYGEIEVEYPWYSGKYLYKDISLRKIMVTNILEIKAYTNDKKYRLIDDIRSKDLPDNGLGSDEKFIDIKIHEFPDYHLASIERQKIKYTREIIIY